MKIAVVVSTFPTISETFVVNQIIYLIDKGHDISILAYNKGKLDKLHQSILDYKLLDKCKFYESPNSNKFKRYYQFFKFIFSFKNANWNVLKNCFKASNNLKSFLSLKLLFKAQWFLNSKFDLIHIHWANNARLIAELKEEAIIDIPYFITFHGYDIQPNLIENYKIDYKLILKHVSLIFVNSIYTDELVKQINYKNNNILLPVSLDTLKFKRNKDKINSDKFKIVFCGRLIKLKGPDIAIEVLNDLVNIKNIHNIELLIIGDGELKQQIVALIDSYKLTNYVKLFGALTQDEIIEKMSESDVFILPGVHEEITNRAETQGLVIQEAQSMQLPVLVSDAGGMKYGLIDNLTGYVIKQNDIKEFSNKIEKLINNPTLKLKMGNDARNFVVKNYDLNYLGNKLENHFYNFLKSNQ